jgi:hypothetical protein
MSAVNKDEKAAQDKSRGMRFKANGEPQSAPGYAENEPSDALVADRQDLLKKGRGGKSALSGSFDNLDAAVSSIKSAESGTRSK